MSKRTLILPSPVKNLSTDAKPSNVKLSCDEIHNIINLCIFRSEQNDRSTSADIGICKDIQFIDNNIEPGKQYYYWGVTLDNDGNINCAWSNDKTEGVEADIPLITGDETDTDTFFYIEKKTTSEAIPIEVNLGWQDIYATNPFPGYGGVIEVYFNGYVKVTSIGKLKDVTANGDFHVQFQEETSPGVWTTLQQSPDLTFIQAIAGGGGGSSDFIRVENIHITGFQTAEEGKTYRGLIRINVTSEIPVGSGMEFTHFREHTKVHKTKMSQVGVNLSEPGAQSAANFYRF